MGPLNIKGLSSGKFRELDNTEVAVLKKAAGL
jgi:16S rRNA U516 pseudouridylate synthase RsuA-like enzyme